MAPPVAGPMVLVPLMPQDGDRLVRAAVDHGVAILGRGPVAGSVAVSGSRAALFLPMLGRGVMTLASFGGCVAPDGGPS